jgi:hypothetical protein
MKAYKASRGIAPLILNLSIRWKCVVNSAPWALYPHGKNPSVPIDQEAGWASELVWTFWRREKSLATAENQTLDVTF